MPMVSESYSDPLAHLKVQKNGSVSYVDVPSGVSKSQIGFRSRPLTPAQEAGVGKASNWGNVVSLIAAYDEIGYEYFAKPERAFVVNDRDYSESRWAPGQFSLAVQLRRDDPAYRQTSDGVISIESVSPSIWPTKPTPSHLASLASGMMRRSVPTASEINLVRVLGESRDAPLMFRAANYVPRSPKEAAGSFLNYVFGIAPTVSDLQKVAETVVSSSSIVRNYVRQEKVRLRRNQSEELWSSSGYGLVKNKNSLYLNKNQSISFGPLLTKCSYILPSWSSSGYDYVIAPTISWSWKASRSVSMFATFEYFIPRPTNILGRLNRYNQLAQRLLGGGLDASTVYDLTPFSWLADWFVDIGGLLRYQSAVSANQVAASSSGYSYWEQLEASVAYMSIRRDPSGIAGGWQLLSSDFSPCVGTFRWRSHTRRKGGPYSLSPTWDLSQQQWAILGALGLARSPGVPITNL